MSSPLISREFSHENPDATSEGLFVGDPHDDDGKVIDTFFIETDKPADPVIEAIKPGPMSVTVVKTTRLIGDTRVINVGDQPFMLTPADPNRKSFKLTVTAPVGTPTATDYVNVADNNGNVSQALNTGAGSGCTRVRAAAYDWTYDGHTGAIWVSGSNGQTISLELTWTAVTL